MGEGFLLKKAEADGRRRQKQFANELNSRTLFSSGQESFQQEITCRRSDQHCELVEGDHVTILDDGAPLLKILKMNRPVGIVEEAGTIMLRTIFQQEDRSPGFCLADVSEGVGPDERFHVIVVPIKHK